MLKKYWTECAMLTDKIAKINVRSQKPLSIGDIIKSPNNAFYQIVKIEKQYFVVCLSSNNQYQGEIC
jgi:hypothetical protein